MSKVDIADIIDLYNIPGRGYIAFLKSRLLLIPQTLVQRRLNVGPVS